MAFTPVVPVTMNLSLVQSLAQEFQSAAVKNLAGAAVDLSAWVFSGVDITSPNPAPNTNDTNFGTVTGSALGILTVVTSVADLATVPPGTALLRIKGKPTSGDDEQLLATGTLTVSPA
jgi:hypothetical protein